MNYEYFCKNIDVAPIISIDFCKNIDVAPIISIDFVEQIVFARHFSIFKLLWLL